ncbi:MAG: hypothetical protein WCT99_08955 [Bacteroidota bacterium]|jgi:hypothetical protein
MNLKNNLKNLRDNYRYRKEYFTWKRNGRPLPPPHFVKQLAIREYRRRYSCTTLVETGTYLGEMVRAQLNYFKKIISIELSSELFHHAKNNFAGRRHIDLRNGDSGEMLKTIVPALNEPALFWLDGHYSGGNTAKGNVGTPILSELETIFQSGLPHVILIDDARLFNGTDDYPTLETLKNVVAKTQYSFSLKDDIIRLTA